MNPARFRTLALLCAMLLMAAAGAEARKGASTKQFEKLIRKYDVADTVLRASDTESFWTLVQRTNRPFRKTAKSLRGKGDQDIKRDLMQLLGECDQYFIYAPRRTDLDAAADSIVTRSGIRGVSPLCMLSVVREPDISAFGYPNGYIFFTEGFYEAAQGDSAILMAAYAEQAVHFVLQHAYTNALARKKRRRIKSIVGIAAVTILTGLTALTDPSGDMSLCIGMPVSSAGDAPRYSIQYTPDQIYEADIIAYRFMQKAGYGGQAYIDMLRRLGYMAEPYAGNGTPSVDDRIGLLEHLRDNPGLRHRVKNLRTRPKSVGNYMEAMSPKNYK